MTPHFPGGELPGITAGRDDLAGWLGGNDSGGKPHTQWKHQEFHDNQPQPRS